MNKQFDNTNSGALFRNEDKESDNHPDYRGTLNVDGTEFWISAWLKTSKKGQRFVSLAVKPKNEPTQGKRVSLSDDMNDEIPF
jgi:uncharacterized protein (DUF736 family)